MTGDGLAGGETQIDRVAHSAPVGGGGIEAAEGVDRDGAQRGLFAQPVVTRGETIEAGRAADAGVAGHTPRRDRTGEPEADVVGEIRVVETRLGEVEPDPTLESRRAGVFHDVDRRRLLAFRFDVVDHHHGRQRVDRTVSGSDPPVESSVST